MADNSPGPAGHRRTREACAMCSKIVPMFGWQAFCSARCRDRSYRARQRAARPGSRPDQDVAPERCELQRRSLPLVGPDQVIRCEACRRPLGEAVGATVAIVDRGRVVVQYNGNGEVTFNAECVGCGSFTRRRLDLPSSPAALHAVMG